MRHFLTFASLLFITVASPSFSQFIGEIDMSGDEQIVFCDSKITSIEEAVFSYAVQKRDRVYFSTFEKRNGSMVAVLEGQGSTFAPSEKSIFVVHGKEAQFDGCFPMDIRDVRLLSERIAMQAIIREEISSFDEEYREASEKSWCQPVQKIDLSDRLAVVLYWEDLEKSDGLVSCLENFSCRIKFGD